MLEPHKKKQGTLQKIINLRLEFARISNEVNHIFIKSCAPNDVSMFVVKELK